MRLNISSEKWQQFPPGGDELKISITPAARAQDLDKNDAESCDACDFINK